MAEQGCNYVPIARWCLQFSLMTKGKNDKWEKKKKEVLLRLLLELSCNVKFFDYFGFGAVNLHFPFLGKSHKRRNRKIECFSCVTIFHCHPLILKFLFSRPLVLLPLWRHYFTVALEATEVFVNWGVTRCLWYAWINLTVE